MTGSVHDRGLLLPWNDGVMVMLYVQFVLKAGASIRDAQCERRQGIDISLVRGALESYSPAWDHRMTFANCTMGNQEIGEGMGNYLGANILTGLAKCKAKSWLRDVRGCHAA